MKIIETKLSNGASIFIEVLSDSGFGNVSSISNHLKVVDKLFDKLVQSQLVAHCDILIGAFEELKKQAVEKQTVPPKKATAEFGIQMSAEGNVCLAKMAAQAHFKVSIEWELT